MPAASHRHSVSAGAQKPLISNWLPTADAESRIYMRSADSGPWQRLQGTSAYGQLRTLDPGCQWQVSSYALATKLRALVDCSRSYLVGKKPEKAKITDDSEEWRSIACSRLDHMTAVGPCLRIECYKTR